MLSAEDLLAAIEVHPGVDRGTVERGRRYARGGKVYQLKADVGSDHLDLSGFVFGSTLYRTAITAERSEQGAELTTDCSCPVGYGCKHAIALATAYAYEERSRRRVNWRTVLDAVLDEPPPVSVHAPPPGAKVAVQIVLPSRGSRNRYERDPGHPRLSVRAVRSGSTKRWVRTGVGWSELSSIAYGTSNPQFSLDPSDVDLLNELKIALISRRGYLMASNEPIDLHDSSPAIWPALAKLVEHGVELVTSENDVDVQLSRAPVELGLDLSSVTDGVALEPGGQLDGEWFAAESVALIGNPVHGAVLWRGRADRPGSSLVLARLGSRISSTLRDWLVDQRRITVDRAGQEEFVAEYLPRLTRSVQVGSRDHSVTLPQAPTIRLQVAVIWHDDGRADLTLRWTYRRGDDRQMFPVDELSNRGGRDRAGELAVLNRIELDDDLWRLLSRDVHGPGTLSAQVQLRNVEAMTFAEQQLPRLDASPDVQLLTNGEPPDFRSVTGEPTVEVSSRGAAQRKDHTDWLDLEVIVSFEDAQLGTVQLDLPRVLEALATGQTKIVVHRGVYVDVDRPELDQLKRLVHDARLLADQPRDGLRLTRQSHSLLAELSDLAGTVDFGPTEQQLTEWTGASARLRALAESREPLPVAALPAGLRAQLRPYQHEGYQWLSFLRRFGLGGILADDMGLGKTLQLLATIAAEREESSGTAHQTPFLVVAPSSVVSTWVREAARFTPQLVVRAVTESQSRRGWAVAPEALEGVDVVVTTYTLFRLEAEQYSALEWAGLVLDEAQQVKNHQSKTHAALRRISARCRFAVTGTPIENNLMELWAILSLTAPGLFPHADAFRTEIAQPIQQEASVEVLADLRRRIRPVMLRRTKDLVAADLPPKQEQVVEVALSPRHRAVYDTHLQRERQRILRLLDDLDENRITVLASLTRLRQLSLDPALLDETYEKIGSAKIDELVARLTEIASEGHRALVFSQFTGFLTRVRERLERAGLETVYLDGRTRRRDAVIQQFREGTAPAFLISLKAGGVGLTLTEADYCFLLDPWWNPATEAQAIDRTHRIGQDRPVMVYRLISAGTIEQRVVELAARKADLYRSVLDADGQLSSNLTAADIAALLET